MNVDELASELEVPVEVLLAEAHRRGIEVSGGSDDLRSVDAAMLRVGMADEGNREVAEEAAAASVGAARADAGDVGAAEDLGGTGDSGRPSGSETVPSARSVDLAPGDLPPTAVGSMPDLAESMTTPADPPTAEEARAARYAGGATAAGTANRPGGPKAPAQLSTGRKVDRSLKRAGAAMALAVIALVGGNALRNPWTIALCWLVGGVLLVLVLIEANKARYHITTHPERLKGLVASLGLILAGGLCAVALGAAVWTVVRDAPAKDAPLGMGDAQSVNQLRWGFQRLREVKDTSWERPAKNAGSCWTAPAGRQKVRRSERIETGGEQVPCRAKHESQVFVVFAVDRDADSPYPGKAALTRLAQKRCGPRVADWNDASDGLPSAGVTLFVEVPKSSGWDSADHDVACVAITAPRAGSLPKK